MDENELNRRVLAARERAAGRSGDFSITVENGSEVEQKRGRNDGRVDVTVKSANAPAPDRRGTIGDEYTMPESFTEPTPGRSVRVGSLLIFHYESGAPFVEARNVAMVETADGKRLRDREGLWVLFQELRALAAVTAKKAGK